jgi:hypothetical protein
MSMAVRQITISQAAKALDIRPELLRHLVAAGVVSGDKSICDFEQAAQIVARLQNARLAADGCGILAREAATKYKFEVNSIYKWHSDGWIKALSEKGRNRIFNEGDIALARELADLVGHTPGRAIFPAKPRSGRPRKSTPPPIPPNP